MPRVFRDYHINQPILFGPNVREGLRGAPPIDPRLLLKIIFYGYSIGTRSSRRLEKATYEDVGFRILCCDQHPDHDTIAAFRKRKMITEPVFGQLKEARRVAIDCDLSQFREITEGQGLTDEFGRL